MEEVSLNATTGAWTSPATVKNASGGGMGPMGSAPTLGVGPTGNLYVFWVGTGSGQNLWEASWNGSSWTGPTDDGSGPLGG